MDIVLWSSKRLSIHIELYVITNLVFSLYLNNCFVKIHLNVGWFYNCFVKIQVKRVLGLLVSS